MVIFERLIVLIVLSFCSLVLYSQNVNLTDSLQAEFNDKIFNDFVVAEQLALKIHHFDEANENNDYRLKSLINLIRIYILKKDYKTARVYIDRAKSIENNKSKIQLKIDLYNAIAYVENIDLNHNASLKYYNKAIEFAQNSKDLLRLSEAYTGKAGLYIGRQEFKEAGELLKLALDIAMTNNYPQVLSRIFYALGLMNYTHKDSAINFYKKALENAIIDNNKFRQGEILADLAFLHLYHSELDRVLPNLEQSIIIARKVDSKTTLHNAYYTYGYYYDALGDYNKSIHYHQKAIDEFGKYVSPVQLSNAYIMLSGALWHNNNFKDAYDYQDKYIVLKDSIFNEEKVKEFNNIRTKYEVEKKDAAIVLLEKENEIEESKKRWYGSSAFFLAIALLGILLFYRHRIRTQKIILYQEQKLHKEEKERLLKEHELNKIKANIKGQDKERNRLAKELHDGIGGRLASINLSLSKINLNLNNDEIKDITNDLTSSFVELRSISHALSTNNLKGKDLEMLLVQLKDKYALLNEFEIELSIFPENALASLDKIITHNLYRILQELMTNIVKHAKAKLVELSFNFHKDVLILIVSDDGVGFNVDKNKYGIGIQNIEERIVTIGGKLTIDSKLGAGTNFVIEVPLKKT